MKFQIDMSQPTDAHPKLGKKLPLFRTWIEQNPGINKFIRDREWLQFYKILLTSLKSLNTENLHRFLDTYLPRLAFNDVPVERLTGSMNHLRSLMLEHVSDSEKSTGKQKALLDSHITLLFDNIVDHIESTYQPHEEIEIVRHVNGEQKYLDTLPLMAYHIQRERFGGSGYYNIAFQSWTGLDSEMFFSDPDWQALIHPEDYPQLVAYLESKVSAGEPLYEFSYRFRNRDGMWHHVSELGKIIYGENNEPAEFHGIITRANFEDEFELENLNLEKIFRFLLADEKDLVVVLDPDARIVYVTPILLQYLNVNHTNGEYVNNYSWKAAGEYFFDLLNYENQTISRSFWRSILVEASPARTLLLKLENWNNDASDIIEFAPVSIERAVHRPLQILWGRVVPNRSAEDDFVDRQEALISIARSLLKYDNIPKLVSDLPDMTCKLLPNAEYAAILERTLEGFAYKCGIGFTDSIMKDRLLISSDLVERIGSTKPFRNLAIRAQSISGKQLRARLHSELSPADYEFLCEYGPLATVGWMFVGQLNSSGAQDRLLIAAGDVIPEKNHRVDVQLFELLLQHAGTACQYIQTQAGLVKAKDRFSILLERSPFAVCILKGDEIRLCNPRYLELTGIPKADAHAAGIWPNIHPEDSAWLKVKLAELSSGNGSFEHEFRLTNSRGETLKCLGIFSQTDYEGQSAILCELLNITRLRRLEDQLLQAQKMETVGILTAAITHDFNNILSAIMPGAQLILRETIDPKIRKQANTIFQLAQRATAITRQLLSYTRMDSLPPDTFDLNALIIDVKPMLRKISGDEITFEYELNEDQPRIRGSQNQIVQILINLVKNSVEAINGSGTIYVRTQAKSVENKNNQLQAFRPGKYIELRIEDNGPGIADDIRSKIFRPFFTTKSDASGSGLGLSIVYGILRRHGGYIFARHSDSGGASIQIYLPAAAESAKPQPDAPRIPVEAPVETADNGTILLVDDSATLLETLSGMVKLLGYDCLECVGGSEALRLYKAHQAKIRLVILDYQMPDMSGDQVYLALKSINPNIRIMMCTGYKDQHKIRQLVNNPDVTILPKPFTIDMIKTRLNGAFANGKE